MVPGHIGDPMAGEQGPQSGVTTTTLVAPHMDVDMWLSRLDLSQYSHLFDTYHGVEVRYVIIICVYFYLKPLLLSSSNSYMYEVSDAL